MIWDMLKSMWGAFVRQFARSNPPSPPGEIYKFSKRSQDELDTCAPSLQILFTEVLKIVDCAVVEGARSQYTQNLYFNQGKSRVRYPNSKHNDVPSNAADVVPCIDGRKSWNVKHCIYLAGIVMAVAHQLGIKIRWGGNWDMDEEIMTDQDFQDLAHYELKEDPS